MEGKVKWFSNDRGYGFIKYLPGEDIYVHFSTILEKGYKSLVKDEEVEFDLIATEKGYKAKNVKTKKRNFK